MIAVMVLQSFMDFTRLNVIPWNTAEFSDLATKLKQFYLEGFVVILKI